MSILIIDPLNRDRGIKLDGLNPQKALEQMLEANAGGYSAAALDQMRAAFFKIPGVFEFLLEEVKKLKPLKRVSDEFPLMSRGEGYDAPDFERFDDFEPRNLLLAYVPRVTECEGQLKLFDVPGAEAYFIELAKNGTNLCDDVQIRLLQRKFGRKVFRMYVYQGGRRCKRAKNKWTVSELLYGD